MFDIKITCIICGSKNCNIIERDHPQFYEDFAFIRCLDCNAEEDLIDSIKRR